MSKQISQQASTSTDGLLISNQSSTNCERVLLSTARVHIRDSGGQLHTCRALLDSGSQANFITKSLANKLKLPCNDTNIEITGIGKQASEVTNATACTINSRVTKFQTQINCFVLKEITETPSAIVISSKIIPIQCKLADDKLNLNDSIDLLLGADIFWRLIKQGKVSLGKGLPTLHDTQLGWIVTGTMPINQRRTMSTLNMQIKTLDQTLQSFWEIENVDSTTKQFSKAESLCEEDFIKHTSRDKSGRFVVHIPFKAESSATFPNIRDIATRRFFALEKRFRKDTQLKQAYSQFMHEYEELGHMSEVKETTEATENNSYYLPHHGVLRPHSSSTKLRVVYDGSCKAGNGQSFNDIQLVGPTVQSDLFSILIRFRRYKYVLAGDVEKMYRQILINEQQRNYQRILWRNNEQEQLRIYILNTVTYGTASAPYLATRCLKQIGIDIEHTHQRESEIIINDFYVDDLLTGSDDLETLRNSKKVITDALACAGFPLRKFYSNASELGNNQSSNDAQSENVTHKPLGIIWNTIHDSIHFEGIKHCPENHPTKRIILSNIAQIYDPLGLVSPVVIKAKLIMQTLWKQNQGWDDPVNDGIMLQWASYLHDLQVIEEIQIQRHAADDGNTHELHGFSDASERAYGAAVYVKTINRDNHATIHLLASKSRVAPLKNVTLPRLELMAAVLLVELMHKIKSSLSGVYKTIYWTDSTIVLHWISSSESQKWKTFVANRVAEIQRHSDSNQWFHVKSEHNPADYISRGLPAEQLRVNNTWWHGPQFLEQESGYEIQRIPSFDTTQTDMLEMKRIAILSVQVSVQLELFHRYSNVNTLFKITAWCLRFMHNCRNKENKRKGELSLLEIDASRNTLVKIAQSESFCNDIQSILSKGYVSTQSKLYQLAPFLKDGVLRVGGRLSNSDIAYNAKHPMILDSKHILTKLIARTEHRKLMHCGTQTLLYQIRQQYWPIGGKILVKAIHRECVRCFRARPRLAQTSMVDLPRSRVTPEAPFSICGTDYAGPIFVKDRKGRGSKKSKAYICLFVCFSTKAVHIELVSDLSTEAFLASLRRFVARRSVGTKGNSFG